MRKSISNHIPRPRDMLNFDINISYPRCLVIVYPIMLSEVQKINQGFMINMNNTRLFKIRILKKIAVLGSKLNEGKQLLFVYKIFLFDG